MDIKSSCKLSYLNISKFYPQINAIKLPFCRHKYNTHHSYCNTVGHHYCRNPTDCLKKMCMCQVRCKLDNLQTASTMPFICKKNSSNAKIHSYSYISNTMPTKHSQKNNS